MGLVMIMEKRQFVGRDILVILDVDKHNLLRVTASSNIV